VATAAKNGVSFILQSSPDGGVTYHTIAGAKKKLEAELQQAQKLESIFPGFENDRSKWLGLL